MNISYKTHCSGAEKLLLLMLVVANSILGEQGEVVLLNLLI